MRLPACSSAALLFPKGSETLQGRTPRTTRNFDLAMVDLDQANRAVNQYPQVGQVSNFRESHPCAQIKS
jgi:hypothetical protein